MEDIKKIIANNIQHLRRETGLTQLDLAERLNYSDKAISKWERGESVPDITVLKQIADMFGVTVDYLLSETHDLPELSFATKKMIRKNRLIIALLSTVMVWLLATIAFVVMSIMPSEIKMLWMSYIVAIPVSCIVLLVFNSIWGKNKLNFIIISVLIWSALLAIVLAIPVAKIWLLFMVGVPSQIIVILSSQVEFKKRLKKKKKKDKNAE